MTPAQTLFSQVSETAATGWRMSTSWRVWSCDVQSAQRYRGGGWSLHSDATVASMHIYITSVHVATTLRARFTNVDQISVQLNQVQRWS